MKTAKRKLTKKKEAEQRKKMAQENTAVVVPDDIVFDILVRLPARSVGRFRCVSKSCLSITTKSTFVRAHSQHSRTFRQSLLIEQPDSAEIFYLVSAIADAGINLCKFNIPLRNSIRASCDGLLCLWSNAIRKRSIFNPLTGRSVVLPTCTRLHTFILAFYFHHSTSEYRLLVAAKDNTRMLVLGENSWKPISCRLPAFCNHSYTVDLNGSLHWLAWKKKPRTNVRVPYIPPPDIILTFHKEAEVYGLFSLPLQENLCYQSSNLVNFNGELGLWGADEHGIDFWVMEECWVKKYSVNYVDASVVLAMFETCPTWLPGVAVSIGDEELLIDINVSGTLHYLVRWNLKSGACFMQKWKTKCPLRVTTFPYLEDLSDPKPASF